MNTVPRTPPPSAGHRAAPPSFDLVLFGGTGDLAMRKLLPALYRRFGDGQVAADARIIGVARATLSREEFQAKAEAACRQFLGDAFRAETWAAFARHLWYVRLDATAAAD